MSLIYIDGFDNVTASSLAAKGWAVGPGSALPALVTSPVRTGTQALQSRASSGTTKDIQRFVGAANEHATLVAGFALHRTAVDTSWSQVIRFLSDGATTDHVGVRWDSGGTFTVTRGDGTILGSPSSAALIPNTWGFVEVRVVLSDSVGAVVVKLNSVTILNLTGVDTKNGGTKTVFDSVRLGTGTGDGRYEAIYDDFYLCNGAGSVNNTFIGDCKVQTVFPNGNGNSSQLAGSDGNTVDNYALVNSATPQTTTYVGGSAVGNEDTYSFADISTATTVVAVQTNAYASKTDAGGRSLASVARRSGTDYVGSDVPLALGSQTFVQQILETDPSTSAAWTAAGVNAAEFGARVRP